MQDLRLQAAHFLTPFVDEGLVQGEPFLVETPGGAEDTLASGNSSTAAATVAYRLGLCDADIIVHMHGGEPEISLAPDFSVRMQGLVMRVSSGSIDREMFEG